MFQNILIPVALDHERNTATAIEVAKTLRGDGGKITLVGVIERVPGYVAEYVVVHSDETLNEAMTGQLRDIAKAHDGIDVAVTTGKPGVAIAELASDVSADLVIIGSHRPGVEDYFLGSTASRVVRRAPCSVMVLRDSQSRNA